MTKTRRDGTTRTFQVSFPFLHSSVTWLSGTWGRSWQQWNTRGTVEDREGLLLEILVKYLEVKKTFAVSQQQTPTCKYMFIDMSRTFLCPVYLHTKIYHVWHIPSTNNTLGLLLSTWDSIKSVNWHGFFELSYSVTGFSVSIHAWNIPTWTYLDIYRSTCQTRLEIFFNILYVCVEQLQPMLDDTEV